MIDHPHCILQLARHLRSILNRFREMQIDDVIPIVRDSYFVPVRFVGGAGSHAKNGSASLAGGQCGDGADGVLVAEGCDFDGEGEAGS